MTFENLTPEQMEKAKACKSVEELAAFAAEEGFELSDEELEALSGGGLPFTCPTLCPMHGRCPKAVDTSGRPCTGYQFQ